MARGSGPGGATKRRRPPDSQPRKFDRDVLPSLLAALPLADRLQCRLVSTDFAEAVGATVAGVAVDLGQRSRAAPVRLLASPAVACLALVSPASAAAAGSAAAAAAQADAWEPEEHRLWQKGGRRLRPAALAWHLRRAASALARPNARSLTLVLAAPELDASASQLHATLAAAVPQGLLAAVRVPQGLLRLDGAHLADRLAACNVHAAGLPQALQSAPFVRLERLALKLAAGDDLPAVLGCIDAQRLPQLACLALLAPASAGVAADLSPLAHPRLARLDLRGVQLTGFAGLQQLTGLRELHVRYDEDDEVPPLNLQGDLAALAPLTQLCTLSLDCLGGGGGLERMTQLTRLHLAPAMGTRVALRGLSRLRRLVVDLSAGSCGRDLLCARRSSVHVPAARHGLAALRELELRCFVWRRCGGDAGEEEQPGEAGSDDEGSLSGSEEGEEEDEGADEGEQEEDGDGSDSDAEVMAEDGAADVTGAAARADDGRREHPVTELEQSYLAALLRRLPTLCRVSLVDTMGVVAEAPQDTKPRAQAVAQAAGVVAAKGEAPGGAGSRASTPGLLLHGTGAACSLAGWRRAVTETPVLGGISQFDLAFERRAL